MDLERALQTLPAERRAAVVLCLANGFSHEDAALTLGMPLGTLKSHVLRGRQQLQSLLEESRYDD
jgi:RNA polymerase sigma-70 factor (ECF subfamily)